MQLPGFGTWIVISDPDLVKKIYVTYVLVPSRSCRAFVPAWYAKRH